MSPAREFRKRSEPGPDILRAVGAELEQPVGPTMETFPFSAMEDGLPLDSSSPLAEAATVTPLALASCKIRSWDFDPETMISFAGSQSSRGAEELRALRSQLYRRREKQPMKSLLVTSALPKEGRSFVAVNLANVLALQPHCRVLLIDADLRGPRLHSVLGTSQTPGLSEYLLQEVDDFSIVQRGVSEELFFIPAGRTVPGPTELLGTGRLNTLISRCGPSFDWVIIDSPATLPVSDASLIANSCDGVLLVVRSHSTAFDIVRQARERFRAESLVGVVLNGTEAESSPHERYQL